MARRQLFLYILCKQKLLFLMRLINRLTALVKIHNKKRLNLWDLKDFFEEQQAV